MVLPGTYEQFQRWAQTSNAAGTSGAGPSSQSETQHETVFADDTTTVPDTGTENPSDEEAPEVHPLQHFTLDQLYHAPGREKLKKLDPTRLDGATWWGQDSKIIRSVSKIMEADMPEPYPNFSSVPRAVQTRWYKAFVQKYYWDYGLNGEVEEKFYQVCARRLKDNVHEWKQKWIEGAPKPKTLRRSIWEGFCRFWGTEKSKSRSSINSNNRNSQRDGYGIAKHTTGATPFVKKREDMRNPETGEYPDMITFVEETHRRKKDKVIIDKKAEALVRRCREIEEETLTQMSQTPDAPADLRLTQAQKDEIYRSQVQGGRGRPFGYGSIPFEETSTRGSSAMSAELAAANAKIRRLEEEYQSSNAQIQELRESQARFQAWCASVMRQEPPNLNVPTAPGTSAPGTSAPGTSAPGTSAPGTSAPPTCDPGTSRTNLPDDQHPDLNLDCLNEIDFI